MTTEERQSLPSKEGDATKADTHPLCCVVCLFLFLTLDNYDV